VTQGVRPTSGIPKGFIPRGRFQRSPGRLGEQCQKNDDWRGRKPESPCTIRGYLQARHARGSKTDQRKRFVFDDVETFASSPHGQLARECDTMPLGMCGRTACPWTSSNARSIENRVWRLPAKELQLPSASFDGDLWVVATACSGSRRLKARGRGDLRLETGIAKLLQA
jgi:hypothetical protein